MPGRDITSRFVYIVTLTWLSMRMGLDILILIFDIKREIAAEGEIGLLNSMMTGESLYLTDTGINEERD